jgi:hypothetical protein
MIGKFNVLLLLLVLLPGRRYILISSTSVYSTSALEQLTGDFGTIEAKVWDRFLLKILHPAGTAPMQIVRNETEIKVETMMITMKQSTYIQNEHC